MKNYTLFLLLILLSCESESVNIAFVSEDYFPLKKGFSATYSVSEEVYSISEPVKKKTYFLKEVVGDSTLDFEGNLRYNLRRFKKQNSTDSWKIDSVWTAYVKPDMAVKVENNIPFLKIAFPVREAQTWDGNSLNSSAEELYKIETKPTYPMSELANYPDAIAVIQRLDSNIIQQNRRLEWYVPGKGLVFKENTVLAYCQDDNCIGSGKITNGFRIIYRRIEE